MAPSSLPKDLDDKTRLYARPLGLGPKGQGLSFPLSGGALSFQAIQLILAAGGKRTFEAAFPLTALGRLKGDLPAALRETLDQTLDNLTRVRRPIGPLSFDKPLLMGVLNLTPDSFSDGGEFLAPERALERAKTLFAEGADILDIGGESTRPGAKPVDEKEELKRLAPILATINTLPGPVSVDTRKAGVMKAALKAGALLINDVSAFTFDEGAFAAAKKAPGMVLMHAQGAPEDMQQNPKYDDVVLEVFDFFEARILACEGAGIARDRLIVDPGIGFGKTVGHNLALMRDLSLFQGLGVPVLAGVSRKRFIGEITGEKDPKKRLGGSLSASLFALSQGAQLVRCHDVREMRQAIKIYQTITSFS